MHTSVDSLELALAQPAAVHELTVTFPKDLARVVIAPAIIELVNLRTLKVNAHEARALTGGELLARLPELRSLSLDLGFGADGELLEFPPWICDMPKLKSLYVGGRFERVPDRLVNLAHLERLGFSGSPRCAVSKRGFSFIPESIGSLGQLLSLSLMNCDVTNLPETIGQLSRLERLSLFDTRLTALPESLCGVASLKELVANYNSELSSVPEALGEAPQLAAVDLSSNARLETVPASLLGVKKLKIEPWKRPKKPGERKSRPYDPMAVLERAGKKKERPAFVPTLREGEHGRSHLGGIPWLAKGEPWPGCAICGQRMPLWVQLFADDAPEEMRSALDGALLQWFRCMGGPSLDRLLEVRREQPSLLDRGRLEELDALVARAGVDLLRQVAGEYAQSHALSDRLRQELQRTGASDANACFLAAAPCMFLAADISGSSFQLARIVDAVGPGHAVAELETPLGTFGPLHIAGWERIMDRPQAGELGVVDYWKVLELLSSEQEELVTRRWNAQREKLGGWPSWLQDRHVRKCTQCRSGLKQLLFQVDQSDLGSVPWGYSGLVYLLQCAKHPRNLTGVAQFS